MADYIGQNGVIVPDTSTLLEEVQAEFKAALGDDLDTSSATPQGRLIEIETLARKGTLDNAAQIANTINPNSSYGTFLDALCALTGTYRKQATKTQVLATITGQANTTIPAGSQAKTEAGDLFQLVDDYTFTETGSASTYFESVESGPIPCTINTLTQIVTPVLGWETINNPSAATIGVALESDTDLKVRRNAELYQGEALANSIISAISQIDGVNSMYLQENYTNGTVVVEGVSIDPHSIYVVVDGGDNQSIAQALYQYKSLGCNYTGDVEVTVAGPYNVQYTTKFNRPTYKPLTISVTVKAPYQSDVEDVAQSVKDALSAWANGEVTGVDGLGLGVDVSPFEASSAITVQVPNIFVNDVQLAFQGGTLSHDTLTVNMYERATIAQDDITVTVVTA